MPMEAYRFVKVLRDVDLAALVGAATPSDTRLVDGGERLTFEGARVLALLAERRMTFDLDFAMNVLACSMPLSVVMILIIYSSGNFFAEPSHVFVVGGAFLAGAAVIILAAFQFIVNKQQTISKTTAETRN